MLTTGANARINCWLRLFPFASRCTYGKRESHTFPFDAWAPLMSASTVFNITQKWRNGADIFSELTEEQVVVLLEALVQGTKLDKDSVTNERLLTVSDWIQHVVETAGAQQLKVERLKKELEEYMDDHHQEMLLRYYQHFVQKLRTEVDRSPVSPLHLNNVQWRVQFQLGQGDFNKVLEPTALVHFDIAPPEQPDKVR